MVRVGFLKKLLSVFLAFSMLMICLPSAFAVTTEPATQASSTTQQMTEATEPATMESFDKLSQEEIEEGYQFGAVLVRYPKVEKIAELLPDFEVVSEWYLDPNTKYVKFKEKTKEIVWRAIEVLKASGEYAEPNRIHVIGVPPEPSEVTEPTITEPLTTVSPEELLKMEIEEGYEFGAILVEGAKVSLEALLPGFEIVSERHLGFGIYYVKFKEKTKEIVWRAIELLRASGQVKYAEPNYYRSLDVLPITEPTEATESATKATQASSAAQQVTEATEPATQASSATQQVTEATESTSLTENTAVTNTENNIIMGDADGDGRLTVADATCVQKFLVALISEQEIDLSAANISKSGTISVRDATEIQRKLVGLLSDW